jgi:hypothetical protein
VAEGEFSPEQLAEQIRQLKVADILLSTVSTLGQLTYVKLDAKQLDEARLAIDAMAALLPALEGHAEPQTLRDFNQLLANVRLAYASSLDISHVQDAGHAPTGQDAASPGGTPGSAATSTASDPDVSRVQDEGHVQSSREASATDTPSDPME